MFRKLRNKWLNFKWNSETGKRFNDLIAKYPISEDELYKISKNVCKYVGWTRYTNFRKLLFIDGDYTKPKIPYAIENVRENKNVAGR